MNIKLSQLVVYYQVRYLPISFIWFGVEICHRVTIISDFELAWLYHGAYLKVINISDGTVQSAWDFSAIIRDNKAEVSNFSVLRLEILLILFWITFCQITSVIEYEINEHGNRAHSKEPQICLIVSYTSTRDTNKAGYISFCHPRTSKILHTITSKEKVSWFRTMSPSHHTACLIEVFPFSDNMFKFNYNKEEPFLPTNRYRQNYVWSFGHRNKKWKFTHHGY